MSTILSVLAQYANARNICLALLAIFVFRRLHAYWRLRAFGGPFTARFSKWWLVRASQRGQLHREFDALLQENGNSLARIGPDDLITNDPNIVRRINAVRKPYVRSSWYFLAKSDPNHDNLGSERDTARHNARRAKMLAGYSKKENPGLEDRADGCVRTLLDLIEREYVSDGAMLKPLEFSRLASYFTFDAVTSVAFSKPYGYVENNKDMYKYHEVIDKAQPASFPFVGTIPAIMQTLHSKYFNWMLPNPSQPEGLGKVISVTHGLVEERFGEKKVVKQDMIGSFVNHGLDENAAKAEAIIQILGGTDTTSVAMRSTLLLIITNPAVHAKVRAEIDAVAQGLDKDEIVSDAATRNMAYFQATIKEALRMYPPAPALMMKNPPPGGDVIDGRFVPENCRISWAIWSMQQRKDIYGADAHVFRPERWLPQNHADEDTLREMTRTHDLIFGAGPWTCPGRQIAWMEVGKVVFELLRRYDVSAVNQEKPWSCTNVGLWIMREMYLRIEKR